MTSHPLTNLLEAFPDFLSTYLLPPWPYLGDGIKLLRAVSKGLGSIAEPAVQSCRVEIGDRLHVPPGRVASLVKDVKLKRLTVLVTICEGEVMCGLCSWSETRCMGVHPPADPSILRLPLLQRKVEQTSVKRKVS